jgi:UDP-N-acetylmuramate--alanine ligase
MSSVFSSHTVHLVGIKGVAMTPLAQLLLDLGKKVTGSDVEEAFVTQEILDRLKIQIFNGFLSEHLGTDVDLVVYSGAHQGSKNPEVLAAKERGISCISHAEALGQVMQGKQGISVCGVGGKSTVTAMITWILEHSGRKPSYSIGVGQAFNLGKTGAYIQDSEWFVAEADEYATDPLVDHTPRFMHQSPSVIVCTNLEFDHPDIYKDFEAVRLAYLKFFQKLPKSGVVVYNGNNEALRNISQELSASNSVNAIEVSDRPEATLRYATYSVSNKTATLQFSFKSKNYMLTLKVPGKFNAFNALYAVAAADAAGISVEESLAALALFTSTKRRFEYIGEKQGVAYYDDYAHHPTEIEATLLALKEWHPTGKIFAIFQSHTFSRTKSLLKEFAASFKHANEVILIDIFASAREANDPTISSDILAQEIAKAGVPAQNLNIIEHVQSYLAEKVKPGDVVITLGAGDLYHLHEHI